MADDYDLIQEYAPFQKKYDLPSYTDLDNNFEFRWKEYTNFPLRFMRRRIGEKLHLLNWVLDRILYPNTQSVVNLHESHNFDEEEKKHILELFKEVMYLQRESLVLDLDTSHEKEAAYIKKLFAIYPRLRDETKKVAESLQEYWKKEVTDEESEVYFG